MRAATVETFKTKDEWLKSRHTGIGSSDAPVILGLSKWKSPLSLYYEKRGLREESEGESEFREWGLALEPAIIAGYERVTHRKVGTPLDLWLATQVPGFEPPPTRYTLARDADMPFLVASPDGSVLPIDKLTPVTEDGKEIVEPPVFYEPGVLEVKNVDISKGREWEEAQEPPLIYQVQVQHQLMVTGAEWASIAALVGGNRFMWADVRRDDDLIAMMRKVEIEFWERCLAGDPPPVDGSESTKDLLARLYPKDTGEIKVLPAEMLEWDRKRAAATAALKAAKAAKQEAENVIRAAIGDATVGQIDGGPAYSWKWQTRRAHTVKESEFRVLRGGSAGDDE